MGKKKLKSKRKLILNSLLVASIVFFVFSVATSKATSFVTVISPSNMQGWTFDINSPDGFGTFVTGPATPPLGNGSVRLFTGTQGNSSIALHNVSYIGVKLTDVTKLEYSTYSNSTGSTASLYPLLIISVDTPVGPDVLRFDPHDQTGATLNTWQTWTNAQNGFWRSQNFGAFPGGSLSEYKAFVDGFGGGDILITDSNGQGGIKIQAGPTGAGDVHDENVDNFTIGINGGDITFDFEPDVVSSPSPTPTPTPSVTPNPSPTPPSKPTDKDQCKNGGWNVFRNPSFKNQGDCISSVNKK